MDVEGLRERNSKIFSKLSKLGYNILGGELNADHSWSSWKLQYDDIFGFLFLKDNQLLRDQLLSSAL